MNSRSCKKVIFRRYRRVGGRVLDARDYGHKAWPICVKRRKKRPTK